LKHKFWRSKIGDNRGRHLLTNGEPKDPRSEKEDTLMERRYSKALPLKIPKK
jgi:hypothetical protein